MDGEQETRYIKAADKTVPAKADHLHEYVRPYAMNYLRRFDGSISERKYKFTLVPRCIECGHTRRMNKTAVEVEVSVKEYHRIKSEERN